MVVYHIKIVIMSYGTYFFFPGCVPQYVCWFSAISNGRSLIKYNKNNELNIFNGIKVLVMLAVLYGHKYLAYATRPILYAKKVEIVIIHFCKYLHLYANMIKKKKPNCVYDFIFLRKKKCICAYVFKVKCIQ